MSNKTPHRIVLTGGPCAGKTTVVEIIKREYSEHVLVVPEVVTMLFSTGYPRPGIEVPFSDEWFINFEKIIVPLQQNMEDLYADMAAERGLSIILCDRGLMDPGAYMPGGHEEFLRAFNLDQQEVLGRYDMIIHLESVSVSHPDLYQQLADADPNHYESADLAKERDRQLQEVWRDHPNWKQVSGAHGIEHVVKSAQELLEPYILKK